MAVTAADVAMAVGGALEGVLVAEMTMATTTMEVPRQEVPAAAEVVVVVVVVVDGSLAPQHPEGVDEEQPGRHLQMTSMVN